MPCKTEKKTTKTVIQSAMSDDGVGKDAPEIIFSFNLFGQNRPQLPLSFLEKLNLPEVFDICSLDCLHLKSFDKHSFFLHFHAATVILVNLTF